MVHIPTPDPSVPVAFLSETAGLQWQQYTPPSLLRAPTTHFTPSGLYPVHPSPTLQSYYFLLLTTLRALGSSRLIPPLS